MVLVCCMPLWDRIKIPKHGQGGAVFSNYDSNQKSDLIQVVLYVHNRVLFDRLKAWADGVLDPDSDETWVVSHTCHEGHNRCGNPAHLFLATNSVNQHQRQCPVPQSVPCPQCNYVQVCTCAQLLNPAMPNGVTLPCITPVARGIAPLALELQQGQARLQQALAQCTQLQVTNTTLQAQVSGLQTQLRIANSHITALNTRLRRSRSG